MSRPWMFEVFFFTLVALFLLAILPTKLFLDPGTFWHIRFGQQIVESGQLPEFDTFSFTVNGKPWISQSWLCQIGMAIFYDLAGLKALLWATTCLLATAFAFLAYRFVQKGLDPLLTTSITCVVFAASAAHFHARPSLITILLLGLLYVFLVDVEHGKKSIRVLWAFVPIFVFWTNIHGGVLGGAATLLIVLTGWVVFWQLNWSTPVKNGRDVIHVLGIMAASMAALLASPYGLELPQFWFSLLSLPLSDMIMEHVPLWHFPGQLVMVILLALGYLLTLFSCRRSEVRVSWLVPLIWLALAWTKNRHAPLFSIVACIALAEMLPLSRVAKILSDRKFFKLPSDLGPRTGVRFLRLALPLLLLVGGVFYERMGDSSSHFKKDENFLGSRLWPFEILPGIENALSQNEGNIRVFNDMKFGGFLILYAPQVPVFIDDRCNLYGEDFLRRYGETQKANMREFDAWDQELSFTHLLVNSGSPLDKHFNQDSDWKIIRKTVPANFYERVTSVRISPNVEKQ